MAADPACIFCKIIAGQIPCFKVYEDDVVLAFLDIGPLVKGHTLIIPKDHVATIMDAPPDLLAAIAQRLPKIANAVLGTTGTAACNLLVNNGAVAQQSVQHLHFHILPRAQGDSFRIPWNAGALDKAVASSMAQQIAGRVGR